MIGLKLVGNGYRATIPLSFLRTLDLYTALTRFYESLNEKNFIFSKEATVSLSTQKVKYGTCISMLTLGRSLLISNFNVIYMWLLI